MTASRLDLQNQGDDRLSVLFSPIRLRDLTLRNRIAVAPMCQYSAVDGVPNAWHMVHLGSRAVGGAGVVLAEMTAVSPNGRITPGCLGLWSDAHVEAFAPIASFIREQGAAAGVQLAHAGRKGARFVPWQGGHSLDDGTRWPLAAPSPINFPGYAMPHAMSEADIDQLVDDFAAATRRARMAGFDVVEAHMAHGYLLHAFLSPLSNLRTDAYGGSLERRAAVPLMVARAMRDAWPQELPVFVRISCVDWVDGGFTLEEAVQFARWLKELGIDLIDCSSGGNVPDEEAPVGPGYHVPFSTTIRKEAGIATGVVGLITEPAQAEEIVFSGAADIVLLARATLRNPYWALDAAEALGADPQWPRQYRRAVSLMRSRPANDDGLVP